MSTMYVASPIYFNKTPIQINNVTVISYVQNNTTNAFSHHLMSFTQTWNEKIETFVTLHNRKFVASVYSLYLA